MALVTFVNNINVISGGLVQSSDPTIQSLNAGAFKIMTSSYGGTANDMSASFDVSDWNLISSESVSYGTVIFPPAPGTPMANDMSASFDPTDWDFPSISSSSFLLQNVFPLTVIGGGGSGTAAVTYLIRGFYLTSGQFEYWSGPSSNTPPPTGHSLVDITIIGEI